MILTKRHLAIALLFGAVTALTHRSAHAQGTGLDGITNSVDKTAHSTASEVTLDPGKRLLIDGKAQKLTKDCAGLDVAVQGQGHKITLKGQCKALTVTGDGNTIVVQAAERIAVTGDNNTVTWAKKINNAPPVITQAGKGNKVKMKGAK
jgi:hypothetical protein